MRNTTQAFEKYLEEFVRSARVGDRLPPIRDFMQRFGVSQQSVQRALEQLREQGVITSQVGRGTFFLIDGAQVQRGEVPSVRGANVRSVLILRRSFSVARGRMLVEALQRRFTQDGCKVLEVAYTDPEHARAVLRGLPRFDACVIQSTYRTVTIEVLAAMREKSQVLAVDGAALVGADVDAVGTEWGEPLALAVHKLQQLGHRQIAYASTTNPFLANQLGLRRFEQIGQTHPDLRMQHIALPQLPEDGYETALVEQIKQCLSSEGKLPFTALIAWGVEDGAKFRELLWRIGLDIPVNLSVILLGRTDVVTEHANFFDMVGAKVEDQVESLYRVITQRWADPQLVYGIQFTPLSSYAGGSTAALLV